MQIFSSAAEYFRKLSIAKDWPEMQHTFEKLAAKEPRGWALPRVSGEALGAKQEQLIPAVTAIGCLQISIILIDDMLDDDPRGEYHRIGPGAAANLASAFQAAGLQAIAESDAQPQVKTAVQASLNHMMLITARGQHLDVTNPDNEAAYWEMVRTKSSPFYGAALHCGALYGGASVELAEQINSFGDLYGEIIQIHDDLNDTMAIPANPDWIAGRFPLPVLFAYVVDHPDRQHFLALREQVSDNEALKEAQKILIRCGAVSYCLDQLIQRYEKAKRDLAAMPLQQRAEMEFLLEEVVDPIRKLMNKIGATIPAALNN
ncbi:MAG: polyprenyl synthetase family protein [Anaerolineae bacterium]|nr:polyprenyl synthetase family protein [Anaerolineae bacterium]